MKQTTLALLVMLALAGPAMAKQSMDQFIDKLMSRMTVEEKLGQLNQLTAPWVNNAPTVSADEYAQVRAGKVGSFLNLYGADATRRAQEVAVNQTRLGIPLLFGYDVIHGMRTIFPIPLAEASSWDPAAVRACARIAATEATAEGVQWTFAPMVDIARDPRWGRIMEGSGEDPYLDSKMAVAKVMGFQGDDLASPDTLLACAKHFAAYGAVEGGRDYNTVDISQRTLRQVYLRPFKAAVDAGVQTFMAAFNEIGGVPCHANQFLLTHILRKQWGFKGMVVSDYKGIQELMAHGVAANRTDAGILAIKAGVDMDMMSRIYENDLAEAVYSGRLPMAVVNRAVGRVLREKYLLGLFDDPYRYCNAERQKNDTLTPAFRRQALHMARESIVLLKNDGTLPLSKHLKSIAVIGPLADDARSCLGAWSAAGQAKDAITISQAIKQALPGARVRQVLGCSVTGKDRSGFAAAVRAARESDAVVLVLGEDYNMTGEARSRASLDLPGVQQALAKAVIGAGKPTAVVLMNGRPLSVRWLAKHAPAMVESWYLGVEMGPAVSDVLFGDYNPGGKLPVTFPRSVGQVPIFYDHKNTGRPPAADNPYTSKYIDMPWTPLYPFGYGLSYTTFAFGPIQLSHSHMRRGQTQEVRLSVTNTGKRAGDEVVQLYLHDEVASITPPVRRLVGFRRVHLKPGQSTTVTFRLTSQDLAFVGPHLKWIVQPGYFTLYAGGSSLATDRAQFELVE